MRRNPLVGRKVRIREQSPNYRRRDGVVLAVLGHLERIEYRIRLAPSDRAPERIAYFPARDVHVLPRQQTDGKPKPERIES